MLSIPDLVPANPPICVLFALPEEAKPFLARWGRRPLSMKCSGAGMEKAAAAAEALHLQMARCLLICGFAGGLAAELAPGDLVFGDSVTNSTGHVFPADSRLLATAESVRLPGIATLSGLIYTENKVLTRSVEKHDLAQRSEALAVDMETFAAAQVADKYHVPWLAARVITDGVEDDMPLDFNAFTNADGNVDKKRVIAATLTHPWKIPGLIRLGARSTKAADNLASFLQVYLKALSDVNL